MNQEYPPVTGVSVSLFAAVIKLLVKQYGDPVMDCDSIESMRQKLTEVENLYRAAATAGFRRSQEAK